MSGTFQPKRQAPLVARLVGQWGKDSKKRKNSLCTSPAPREPPAMPAAQGGGPGCRGGPRGSAGQSKGRWGRTGESLRTPSGTSLPSAVPGPGGPSHPLPVAPRDGRSGGSAARPWPPASQARAAPSTGPGTPWEREVAGSAGRKRGHWAGTASPRSVRPGARGAGRGPGSSPPAPAAPPPSWLWLGCARRSPIGGGNDGDYGAPGAVSSEAVAAGTAQGLVAPRFRLQRPGSPRAAPSTSRPGAGQDPTLHRAVSPRCPPSPPGGPPLSRAVPTLGPRAQLPSASWARLAAACPWGPTPTSQVLAAPSTRCLPAPGVRSPRRGPRRARAGLSRTCKNAGGGRAASRAPAPAPVGARASSRGPATPACPASAPRAPGPGSARSAAAAAGPGTHHVLEAAPGAGGSEKRAAAGTRAGGRPQPGAGSACSGARRRAPAPGRPPRAVAARLTLSRAVRARGQPAGRAGGAGCGPDPSHRVQPEFESNSSATAQRETGSRWRGPRQRPGSFVS
ncbi:collagen alpha-1(I) chain-like [Ovis aries]|uniref:collagen alpha-1(I) chain-like n=1 Tax=Ovis aries TaxID=9940 RepID=UPI0005FB10DA|nr:collagen alpha-1(I) chain-like [Ovis aries]